MNGDPMLIFHRECEEKYARGVVEHRGGDRTRPFVGDVFDEYCQEQLDSVNYLYDALLRGAISQEVFEYGFQRHFEMWWWGKTQEK